MNGYAMMKKSKAFESIPSASRIYQMQSDGFAGVPGETFAVCFPPAIKHQKSVAPCLSSHFTMTSEVSWHRSKPHATVIISRFLV